MRTLKAINTLELSEDSRYRATAPFDSLSRRTGGALWRGDGWHTRQDRRAQGRDLRRKKRRWREDQRIIQVDLLPHWQGRKAKKATKIGRRDVAAVLDANVERDAPIMANPTKALISKIYNFGIGRDIVEHNSCLEVAARQGAPERPGARQRGDPRHLARARRGGADHGHHLQDAAPHGAARRRGAEDALARRRRRLVDDPCRDRQERSGARRADQPAGSSRARGAAAEDRLFGVGLREPAPARSAHRRRAEGRRPDRQGRWRRLRAHDLRRTAATFMTSMGVSRLVVSKILNHVESGVTAVYYRHSYDEEKREALTRWGRRSRR